MKNTTYTMTALFACLALGMATLISGLGSALAMGSTHGYEETRYQIHIDLEATGEAGRLPIGEQVVAGRVYTQRLLADGTYFHLKGGLPRNEIHYVVLEVFTDQNELLFEGLVELDELGNFTQTIMVPEERVVTVSASMATMVRSYRPMRSNVFEGTSVEQSYISIDDSASLVLDLLVSTRNSNSSLDIEGHEVTCTLSPQLGEWVRAGCQGLEAITFESAQGIELASALEVMVDGDPASSGSVSGEVQLRLKPTFFNVGCISPWLSETDTWSFDWDGVVNEDGQVDANVESGSFLHSRNRFSCEGFLNGQPVLRSSSKRYEVEVLDTTALQVTFR